MARLTIAELTVPLTRAEVQASIYDVLAAVGVNTSAWKPGSVVRTMIVGVSAVFAAYSSLMASIARSGFLETSDGEWLTLVAWYVYGVERRAASSAAGDVVFTLTGGAIYNLDPGDVIVRNAATGHTYRNTEAFTLDPAHPIATVGVVATEAGTDSNADAHAISQLVTSLLGVTVDNPVALFGADVEGDPSLRQRCTERLGALSPMGPWDAYSVALRNAVRQDGTNIGIARISLVVDGYGHVDCYCATATGAVTGDMTDPATDLGAAQLAVLQNAAPQAVTARVYGATELPLAVTYSVWMYNTTGQTVVQITDRIHDAIVAFIRAQPVGGNVIDPALPGHIFIDALRSAIAATYREIFHVEVTAPPTDQALTKQQVATVGAITATQIVQVPPPEAFYS